MKPLSLVIPCYNEAKGLPGLLGRLGEVFGPHADSVEVILVDNGSSDGSGLLIEAACMEYGFLRMLRVEKNQGYGYGILQGLKVASGNYIGWTHADMQTDPADVLAVLSQLSAHRDAPPIFFKGRRYGRPVADVFFSVSMSVFESLLFGKALWDINAQPTLFPRAFFDSWAEPPHDFALDLYAYAAAKQEGLIIRRFPVYFGQRRHGHSHWNVDLKSKMRFIRRTLSFSVELRRKWKR